MIYGGNMMSNFSGAINSQDNDMAKDVLLSEIHKVLDKNPEVLIDALNNSEIATPSTISKRELIHKVVEALYESEKFRDNMVNSLSAFWDTTATSQLKGSMKELQTAIHKLGNVAGEVEGMLISEKVKFAKIMTNVESITLNLKKSNEEVSSIIGNTKKLTDDLVTADFKTVISNASQTLKNLNAVLDNAQKGNGSLGKLLNDEKLYNELVGTNNDLQNLVTDLTLHPERYIHFSVLGSKTKGLPLTGNEEKKLRKLLDSIPD